MDIDDALVRAAWRRRRTVWSLQRPSEKISLESHDDAKRHSAETTIGRADYFPISCEHEFGYLPVPPSETRGRRTFPHNVSFRTADWTCTEILEDAEHYNVVIAYGIITFHPNLPDLIILLLVSQYLNGYT